MAFTDLYSSILSPFVKSYKEATNEKKRALVLKNAADAVLESRHLLEDTGIDLPKDLKKVCLFSFGILKASLLITLSGYHSVYQRPYGEGNNCGGWGSQTNQNQTSLHDPGCGETTLPRTSRGQNSVQAN